MVIASAVVLCALLADGYLRREGMEAEMYVFMPLSAAGGVMASANDLIVMFLGLETPRWRRAAAMHPSGMTSQAGIKYFVLAPSPRRSSSRHRHGLRRHRLHEHGEDRQFLADGAAAGLGIGLIGFAFLLVGFATPKIAAVPIHFWTPDVYQAPLRGVPSWPRRSGWRASPGSSGSSA